VNWWCGIVRLGHKVDGKKIIHEPKGCATRALSVRRLALDLDSGAKLGLK